MDKELKKFNEVWPFVNQRGEITQRKYEDILFSIWKHHPYWKADEPIQIDAFRDPTIYRVIERAEKAGLLKKVGNYQVGISNRKYHKNHSLFNTVFRNAENKYKLWNDDCKNNPQRDIILKLRIKKYKDTIKYKKIKPVDITVSERKKAIRKSKSYHYDLEKLYKLSEEILPKYNRLIEKMNKHAVDEQLMFYKGELHFDNKGLPTGRPYSYFCSTPNPNKKQKIVPLETRAEFLEKIGLSDYYEVYDVKCEIPRISWLFHTGEWKDDSYDFYNEIIKDTELDKYLGWTLKRGQDKYTEYEDSMKSLFMRIYFGKGSYKQSYNGYLDNKLKRLGDDYMDYWIAQDEGFQLDLDIWKEICISTKKICGSSIGALIFWFAFFIQTEVKIELLKRGKVVYNIYDGFYYNQDIKNEIKELLREKAIFVYNKYMKVIKI